MSVKINYRAEAGKCLQRAKLELGKHDDARIKYAALEIRMALEVLLTVTWVDVAVRSASTT